MKCQCKGLTGDYPCPYDVQDGRRYCDVCLHVARCRYNIPVSEGGAKA